MSSVDDLNGFFSFLAEDTLTLEGSPVLLVEFLQNGSIRQAITGDLRAEHTQPHRKSVRAYRFSSQSQGEEDQLTYIPTPVLPIVGAYWVRSVLANGNLAKNSIRHFFGRSFAERYLRPRLESQPIRKFLLSRKTVSDIQSAISGQREIRCRACSGAWRIKGNQGDQNYQCPCGHIQWVATWEAYGGCGTDYSGKEELYKKSVWALLDQVSEVSSLIELSAALVAGCYAIDPRYPLNHWRKQHGSHPYFGFARQNLRGKEPWPRYPRLDPHFCDPALNPGICWLLSLGPSGSEEADFMTAKWIDEYVLTRKKN